MLQQGLLYWLRERINIFIRRDAIDKHIYQKRSQYNVTKHTTIHFLNNEPCYFLVLNDFSFCTVIKMKF